MSDIEQRITDWRAQLDQSQATSAADIDELENHLREEMAGLQTTGLSEMEAFLVARYRLGDTSALAAEFRKINGDRRSLDRLSWMALGAFVYLMGSYVASGVSRGGIVVAAYLGVRGYNLGTVGVAVKAAAIVGLFALIWAVSQRWIRMESARRWLTSSTPKLTLLCATLVVVDLVLIAFQLLSGLAAARSLSPDDFGRSSLVIGSAGLVWTFLAPILAAVLVVVLRARALRGRDACVAGPSE